jgi:hypothetical protein
MPTSIANGTVTPTTLGVEQDFAAADTTNKTYVLVVDTFNLANGEEVEFTLYTKVLSGGTERIAYRKSYTHAQIEAIKYSPPVPADISFKASIKQTGGTLRAYAWKVLSL